MTEIIRTGGPTKTKLIYDETDIQPVLIFLSQCSTITTKKSKSFWKRLGEPFFREIRRNDAIIIATRSGAIYNSGRYEDKDFDTFNYNGSNIYNEILYNFGGKQFFLFDLSPFEVINYQQWSGEEGPWKGLDDAGRHIQETTPYWEIAATDNRSGQRIVYIHANPPRDHIFTVCTQLNNTLDYVRDLLKPWEDVLRENYEFYQPKANRDKPAPDPDATKQMMLHVKQQWAENRPNWTWI